MGLGRGDDRDRHARRRRGQCVGVRATVAGIVGMVVIVIVTMAVAMTVPAGRIGAALGLEAAPIDDVDCSRAV